MEVLKNYIGGRHIDALSGKTLDVSNPATAEVYASIPDSDEADVDQAVQAALVAAPGWERTAPYERARILLRLAQLLEEQLDRFVAAETRDTGKPLSLSRAVDIPRAVQNIRFYAAAIQQFTSQASVHAKTGINYVSRKPCGVVACISPWNLPLYLFTWKVMPALAAGNAVVAKPSEVTPYTAYLLSELCTEAGLPDGVLNIVQGTGVRAGAALCRHPQIPAISFTGGTATGIEIARHAAPALKKLSLELGGKNPTIVFDDCDFASTVKTAVKAAFANQGQICLCGSRILVQNSIYKRFQEAFLEEAKKLRVGDPLDPTTTTGSLVSKEHFDKVMRCIETAREEGARITLGGAAVNPEGPCAHGYFIEPTVIEGLDAFSTTNQREIFGPVTSLIQFSTEEEAIQFANATPYGLSASVWTSSLNRAHRVAQALESGIVWINCWLLRDLTTPFGGVKQSGIGREGGMESLEFFTEPKTVCVAVSEENL